MPASRGAQSFVLHLLLQQASQKAQQEQEKCNQVRTKWMFTAKPVEANNLSTSECLRAISHPMAASTQCKMFPTDSMQASIQHGASAISDANRFLEITLLTTERQLSQFIKDTCWHRGRRAADAAYRSARRPCAQFITLPRHILSSPLAWYLGLGCWSLHHWCWMPAAAVLRSCQAERWQRQCLFSFPVCINHIAWGLQFETDKAPEGDGI